MIHHQLPLAMPCYDFTLVTELTVVRHKVRIKAFPAPLV